MIDQKRWYEEIFENCGWKYDGEVYTRGTVGECDFIEKELNYDKNLNILDVGCGTGRHAIELSRRGYNSVTVIDLSESQLARARVRAANLGVVCVFSSVMPGICRLSEILMLPSCSAEVDFR